MNSAYNMSMATWTEFITRYQKDLGKRADREADEQGLITGMLAAIERYKPVGFILLECQMLDSSSLGQLTVLPYGPNNTLKAIPDGPMSPKGMASDMAIVVSSLDVCDVPRPSIRCDQCEACMINGVFCHETGCPNKGKRYEDGEWISQRVCGECGCTVDEDDQCCGEFDDEELDD